MTKTPPELMDGRARFKYQIEPFFINHTKGTKMNESNSDFNIFKGFMWNIRFVLASESQIAI